MIFLLLGFLIVQFFLIYLLNQRNMFSPSLIVDASLLLSAIVLVTNWKFFGYEDISGKCVAIVSLSIIFMTVGEFLIKQYVKRGTVLHINSVNRRANQENENLDAIEKPYVISKVFVFVVVVVGALVTIARANAVYKLSILLGNRAGIWASFSYVRMYVNAGFTVEIGKLITYPAVFVKAASLYCIYVFCHNKVYCKTSSYILIIPCLVYSAYTLTTTARTGLLEMGSAFAIIFYAFNAQKNGSSVAKSGKMIKMTIIILIMLSVFFIVTGNVRSLAHQDNTASDLINYAGSPLIVFSRWLESYEHSSVVGTATMPGLINILNRLGITKASLSHADIYSAEDVLANSKSNLKTWLKAPIQDFYLGGMLLSRFILGMIYSVLSVRIMNKKFAFYHPGRFIFSCLLFYPLVSACIADKYGNYIQLETVYMAMLFYAFAMLRRGWELYDNKKNIQ